MSTWLAPTDAPLLVVDDERLGQVADAAASARRVALDVEASGMHAYRARPCVLQLAWNGAVAIVDALAVAPAALARLLGADGPVKIVHDVAFDARILAESGVLLGNVHDTSIAARMLGRAATGLAALLESELGIRVSKDMQHHDWRIRPIDVAMMAYLQEDVRHLEALEARLWSELAERGIEDAVIEETQYRLGCAAESGTATRDDLPYMRIKGADKLNARELAALRAIVPLREREAERRDVPPYRIATPDALLHLAKTRPATEADVARVRGLLATPDAADFVSDLARALAEAPPSIPDDERERLRPPRIAMDEIRARREREARLMAWRRDEAKRRSVDEQALLPGHCVKDLAAANARTAEELARVPGIGAFRVERDSAAILRALRGEDPGA
jgi:ribonuclease D